MCYFMYIKNLKIFKKDEILRDMNFNIGLNLIIDETPINDNKKTGNNVGKTTVLKLIDYCLGGKADAIYKDEENKKEVYNLVKEYLIKEDILIRLELTKDLKNPLSDNVIIERNFKKHKKCIRKINNEDVSDRDFDKKLRSIFFPNHLNEKPTLRQIISHNIRYKNESINRTIKTLSNFTTEVEYETLYLFLLGCVSEQGAKKQNLFKKIKQEQLFKKRLEKIQTKTAYESALDLIEDEIISLNNKKATLNINENFENDLKLLNDVKYKINKSSSFVSKLKIRKSIIDEAQFEMKQNVSQIDLNELKSLYNEANTNIKGIQKTFEDLVKFHNTMLNEKIKFITAELPELILKINKEEKNISNLLKSEKELSEKIAKSDSFSDLEHIISELNEKYRLKGEYENVISQINEIEENINNLDSKIRKIDEDLFSDEFELKLKEKIRSFNKYFSSISTELYNEKYALKYDPTVDKNNRQLYKFSAFNANMSSGKKQGEIVSFDFAYILFADSQNIPCLHFLLNDKKELMHDNQLKKVSEFAKKNNIQFVISILKDKLPEGLEDEGYVVVRLSQEDKLFKIEN